MNRLFLFAFLVPVLFFSCSSSGKDKKNTIIVKGSDTEVNFVLSLAEAFMEKDSTVSISVTGGGSGTGVTSLINGETDIANSSRPLKAEEHDMAEAQGVKPTPIVIAVDAMAVIVNENLEVDSLSMPQLAGLFNGEIRNWKDLGGADMEISLYGRQSNSGTFVFFRDSVLKSEYSQQLKQMNGNAQIVEGIKQDPAGVGYVGLGYVMNAQDQVSQGIKVLPVQGEASAEAISPLYRENIRSGAYPLIRPLFQFTDGVPQGKTRAFIEFILSEKGQSIVEEDGYYPVSPKYRKQNRQILGSDEED